MPSEPQSPKALSYVLITPAHNEEKQIERLIRSVISQTVLPIRWIIVNDASTDATMKIVQPYLVSHPWMELISMPVVRKRSFSAKVDCFNAGYSAVRNLDYEIVGNLDADVSFEGDYLEFLLEKFRTNPNLGVAGTPFIEDGGYDSMTDSFEGERHVPGGCQLFRRQCFESIGGYHPNAEGGIDWIAVTTARMKGWWTQSFRDKKFHHHRCLGTANRGSFDAIFQYGKKDYLLGNHPLWELLRAAYRMTRAPLLSGGLVLFFGYLYVSVKRTKRPISEELLHFHRQEEKDKLRTIIKIILAGRKLDKYSLGI